MTRRTSFRVLGLFGFAFLLTAVRFAEVDGGSAALAEPGGSGGEVATAARPAGPEPRIPWTTSRFAGTPEPPPPYRVELAFPKLRFESPLAMATAAGVDRIFVLEEGGKVYSFPNDPAAEAPDLALDLAAQGPGMGQAFGLAFHPRFKENRQAFLCYTLRGGGPEGTRVSRFRMSALDPPRLDPGSEEVLITWPAGGHNGGCLAFGPDGHLYISTGDQANPTPPDPLKTGQDITDLLSSILRIDVDGRADGRPYRIPPDNPFLDEPGARPEVWAFGFRNPWRMSFDRETGDLWVGDVGWELWEMIDRVVRGGNYGWSLMEGPNPVHADGPRGPGPILPPIVAHPHSEAASITGGYVYRGQALPDLVGVYLYGDYQSGKVWGLRFEGDQVSWRGEVANTPLQLVAFGQDHEGEVYAIDYQRTGQVYRFVPNPSMAKGHDFPRRLSQTGLFASTADHRPAPGVVPYAIQAELWSDGARAERLLGVPGTAQIKIGTRGNWEFPEGSVLARTVSLDLGLGDPARQRRIETQVLHFEDGSWRPYTYLWDEPETDATLVDAGGEDLQLTILDEDAPGGVRGHPYRVHARSECVLCHNPWVEKRTTMFGRQSASPLAANTAQLNAGRSEGGRDEAQLRAFLRLGLLEGPLPAPPEDLPRLADPYDDRADLDLRARSYLQVNCAHCHQFGAGGSANIVLTFDLPMEQTKTIDAPPLQGSFGLENARIIALGDPEGSVLFYRMAKLGGGRMPRIGSVEVDVKALRLMHEWIAQLGVEIATEKKTTIFLKRHSRKRRLSISPKTFGRDHAILRVLASR